MSLIENPGLEIGRRIKALRESLPAPADRKTASQIAYPSQAEFAEMVGTDRFRVIDWEQGAIPDKRFREKLAELAGGDVTPEYFTVNAQERTAEISALLARIGGLERDRAADRETIANLSQQLRDLRAEQQRENEAILKELRQLRDTRRVS